MAAKHLKDFIDLSAEELKFYLQQSALQIGGTHSDLAALALVAFEQQVPEKESAEHIAKTLQTDHQKLLQQYGMQQDPFEMAHKSHNPVPNYSLNNIAKQEFDPRPSAQRVITIGEKESLSTTEHPDAVMNISFAPPQDIPPYKLMEENMRKEKQIAAIDDMETNVLIISLRYFRNQPRLKLGKRNMQII
eukprot:gene10136-18800_t